MEKGPMEENKVRASTWEDFTAKARDFCANYPDARYVVKFRNKENVAVLKLAAGSEVLKYRTTSSEDTGKIEEFNKFFLSLASGIKEEKGRSLCKCSRQR
eukprot:TRINITY_DN2387_c0_g1_i9.p4 TRINITY_DN2387_c0_g1~~TRINITY_DN2387_c0_g1_i9.p4  ORF type:complete len:100 (-),score=22.75 TRINITY_DN2387_c0_g1_i9:159-458(-)